MKRRGARRAPRWRALLGAALLLAVALGSAAHAQDAPDGVCGEELEHARRAVADEGNGVAAAHLLRAAVTLLEPALPPEPNAEPRDDLSAYPDARWLAERRLLPPNWDPETLAPGDWKAVLDRWRSRYGLEPAATENAAAPRALALDLSRTLADLSRTVRPLGLVAREGDRAVFNATIWNYTPYPRLLVLRPPARMEGELDADGEIERALAALSSCARPVEAYLATTAGAAYDLFLSTSQSRLRVLASTPSAPERWPLEVARDGADAFFGFRAPELEGIDAISVVFEGPSMTVGSLLGILPRTSGNVGVFEIRRFLEFP